MGPEMLLTSEPGALAGESSEVGVCSAQGLLLAGRVPGGGVLCTAGREVLNRLCWFSLCCLLVTRRLFSSSVCFLLSCYFAFIFHVRLLTERKHSQGDFTKSSILTQTLQKMF